MPQAGDEPHVDWQQHYPTYTFWQRDVVLAEYESAATTVETEERLFINSSNVTLVVAAGVSSLALGSLQKLYDSASAFLAVESVFTLLVLMVTLFSALTLKYFAERQKSILFAKRKLVVLRRILGLNYGSLQLVLPNWRHEGASQPFAVQLFPGWGSYAAYPFWIISVFACILLFFLSAHLWGTTALGHTVPSLGPEAVGGIVAAVWLALFASLYRSSLYDTHERPLLSITRLAAATLRLRLVDSFEYVIYRAKLAVFELDRVGVSLAPLEQAAVFIEDREFLTHHGVSFRGSARAARDFLLRRRWSGGSTVTQQLARSLFIVEYHKLIRRKVIEILLALWLERVFTKSELIRLYLASVRFDSGVYGAAAAAHHFLGQVRRPLELSQAFFLVERVSNIRSRVLVKRIDQLVQQACDRNLLAAADAAAVAAIYERLVRDGRLTPNDPEAFQRFLGKWRKA